MNGMIGIIVRDMKRIWTQPLRMAGGIVQPLLYLFLLGSGIGAATVLGQGRYLSFIFPGIVALSLLFTATFAAITIVFDRETGFLKAVLVAPVSRRAIAVGKVISGAIQAMIQGILLLIFAPIVGVYFSFVQIILFLIFMLLSALLFSAVGVATATSFSSTEVFPVVLNAVLLPMFFLSGALYPLRTSPEWIKVLAHVDPVAYGVDLMRGAAQGHYYFTVWISIVVTFGLLFLLIWGAIRQFEKERED